MTFGIDGAYRRVSFHPWSLWSSLVMDGDILVEGRHAAGPLTGHNKSKKKQSKSLGINLRCSASSDFHFAKQKE